MTKTARAASSEAQYQRLQAIIRGQSLLTGGNFTLASGAASSVFFDMKKTLFDPEGVQLIARLMIEALAGESLDSVGGLELGAVPIVAAICAQSHPQRPIRGFFVRKQPKGHGTNQLVDGRFQDGDRCVILEDVTTTGGSAMKAVAAVRQRGGQVLSVLTIVDRLEGAEAAFAKEGLGLRALFDARDFL